MMARYPKSLLGVGVCNGHAPALVTVLNRVWNTEAADTTVAVCITVCTEVAL